MRRPRDLLRLAFRSLAPWALGAAFAFTGGCAKKPTMKVNHAEIRGLSVGFPPSLAVVMNVVMDVYNPNSYDVAIRAMRGTAVFAERYSLPIDYRAPDQGVWLRADATTPVSVPVNVPVDLALRLMNEAYAVPTIPVRVTGRADVTATSTFKIEKDDYEVDERTEISRQQMQAAVGGLVFPGAR